MGKQAVAVAVIAFALLGTNVPSDAAWFPDGRLTFDPGTSVTSLNNARNVAAGCSGYAHAVWGDFRDGNSQIRYMRYNGVGWGADTVLTSSPGFAGNPAIAAESDGTLHVVWNDTKDGDSEIYYRSYDGSIWSPEERLTYALSNSQSPSVAVGADGTVHVAWHDFRDGDFEIYYKRYNGTTWEADERLTNSIGISMYASVAVDDSGRIHVVWQDYNDADYEIYYRRHDGASWEPAERLTASPGFSVFPCIAARGQDVHVAWSDKRDGNYEIYYIKNAYGGWGSEERLTSDEGASQYPSVAVGPDGRVRVAWSDDRDGNLEIYHKRFEGVMWGPAERLTNAAGVSQNPSLSVGENLVTHVIWYDNRDGNNEIYWKRTVIGGLAPPTVHALAPDSAYYCETVRLLIVSGDGFMFPDSVWIEKTGEPRVLAGATMVVSATELSCGIDLLGASTGWWDVVVKNPDGQAGTLSAGFEIVGAPKPGISGVSPDSGAYGDYMSSMELAGAGFVFPDSVWLQREGESRVIVEGPDVIPPGMITFDLDLYDVSRGWWDIVVKNPDGQSDTLSPGFYVIAAPKPETFSMSPDSVPYGDIIHGVVLSGSGFMGPASVKLQKDGEPDRVASDVTVVSAEVVAFTIGFYLAHRGYWDVVVENRDGQMDTLLSGVYVVPLPDPEVHSLYPAHGFVGEGTDIGSPGAHFVDPVSVRFEKTGMTPLEPFMIDLHSSDYVTCALNLEGAPPGEWDFIISNPDGGEDTLLAAFEISPCMWNVDVRLTDPAYESHLSWPNAKTIAADALGNVHVVWSDSRSGGAQVYYRKFNGETWSEDERVTNTGQGAWSPAVAVTDSGTVHMVWHDRRDGNYEVYYNRRDGSGWGVAQRLTDAPDFSVYPSVAAGEDGTVHVVWHDKRSGNDDIYYRQFNGTDWDPEVQLTSDGNESRYPSVAACSDGTVHVLWGNEYPGDREIFWRRFDGYTWSAPQVLAPPSARWCCVTAGPAGRAYATWSCGDGVAVREFDGAAWQAAEIVTTCSDGSYSSIAADDSGRVHIVWMQNPLHCGESYVRGWEIYYRRFNGSAWGVIRRLTGAVYQSARPSIALGLPGTVHVAWEDSREGERGVFYKYGNTNNYAAVDYRAGEVMAEARIRVFPNPSRGTAAFWLEPLPKTRSRIAVYDVTGRLVWEHDVQPGADGPCSVQWDGCDRSGVSVSAGIYFVHLDAGGRSTTAKIVVLR